MIDTTKLSTSVLGDFSGLKKSLNTKEAAPAAGFSDLLSDMINKASSSENVSSSLDRAIQNNDSSVTIEESILASSKAGLEFQMLVTVRNKVVQAYTDIMNMPV
jgi:flagellar hook-basal body complex protein FliE